MPELPEVETVKRGLSTLIVGKKIRSATTDNQKSFPNNKVDVSQFLISSQVRGVRRRAKVLLIDLSTDYSLMIHLKMTGQLVFVGRQKLKPLNSKHGILNKAKIQKYQNSDLEFGKFKETRFGAGHPNDSLINKLPDKSTRVIIEFADGSHLFFNDQRKFGWMKLLPTELIKVHPFMAKVGPEPLSDDFSPLQFAARFIRRPNTSIKAALLDQTVIAGVGNIYADEALWGAKIHPATLVKNLTKKQLEKLYEEVRYVLNLSIEKGGSTDRNYVNAEGKKGSYIKFARVFRRENQPCLRCGRAIIKLKVAGRGAHICSKCQKLPQNRP